MYYIIREIEHYVVRMFLKLLKIQGNENCCTQFWNKFYMTSSREFPNEDLKSTLDNLQSCLSKAEREFSDDKDLSDSIKQTQETVTRTNDQLKTR
jgi:hypothetical protein